MDRYIRNKLVFILNFKGEKLIQTEKRSGIVNKRMKKKKRKVCDFCSNKTNTEKIYTDLQICKMCLESENKRFAIAESIEG